MKPQHVEDYENGRAYHKQGGSLSANPFPQHDRRHWDWALGWTSADNEALKKRGDQTLALWWKNRQASR